ncbi:nickel-dependent hydrogenase large subunit [Telmatospirillum sp. J64-1]|uniref:hydrogenase large subunit n=1 Tax=Telmatospirillum sp. J64-1 TaxID=2502183 RepID=UPI00115ED798|nr:nickel-dependent hydrogenase large subunit [Telmatospirillum sp. J64-1]
MITGKTTLLHYLSFSRPVAAHQPWPRFVLDEAAWRGLVAELAVEDWDVLGLWADGNEIHCALRDEETGEIAVASHSCTDRRFASLSQVRPGVLRLERAVADLYGLQAAGNPDGRPWLDHGRWGVTHPLALARRPPPPAPYAYSFLPVEGEGLHQIPVGPVHAGIIEPGHFRFHCAGETVVRLEERLGWVHRGLEGALIGKPVAQAAKLVGRVSGDSTVAYAIAFARAVEAASGAEAPARAHWLRALMAELERIANHIFDFGAICNDAAFALMLGECSVLREEILRICESCFGHRLMMDAVVPGGVACDLTAEGAALLQDMLARLRPRFEELVELYDNSPSLLDRTVGTGVCTPALARQFGATGFVGRASGRAVDARRLPGYPPYDQMELPVPVRQDGDVNARIWIRIEEIRASLDLIGRILSQMPPGPLHTPIPTRGGEGMALVEGFRGEILVWVRLSQVGRIVRCHPRDPSWFQWPLLEAAIEGNIVADFPLCNKSFNCSYAGVDL